MKDGWKMLPKKNIKIYVSMLIYKTNYYYFLGSKKNIKFSYVLPRDICVCHLKNIFIENSNGQHISYIDHPKLPSNLQRRSFILPKN